MATYPTLNLDGKNSAMTLRDGREVDTTGDGFGRVRKLYDDRADFVLKHPQLTAADVATFNAFYAANGGVAFDFLWPLDGITYSVRFGAPAFKKQWASPTRTDVTVNLVASP